MRRYRFVTPVLLGLCFVAFASLAPQPVEAAAEPQVAALAPGMARVWFLRPTASLNGNVWAASPVIYANGASIGDIPAGAEFYRDFRPGTYRFTVQPYGLPTGAADTVYLAPGTQTYLEIQWLASWEGRPGGRLQLRAKYLRHSDDVAAAGAGLSPDIDVPPRVSGGAREDSE